MSAVEPSREPAAEQADRSPGPASASFVSPLKAALMIDAGYLLAAAGQLFCSTGRRADVGCDYEALLTALGAEIERREPASRLFRVYWYDATVDARPTVEQLRVGRIARVKLRLGRLAKGRQKGVDAMMCLDLLTLAQRRAVDRVYLVSGDEDLREAIGEAQRYGVEVELISTPAPPEGQAFNLSAQLVGEVDTLLSLPESFWEPYFRFRDRAEETDDALVAQARGLGHQFAERFASERPEDEIVVVLAAFPNLPHQVDIELLIWAEETMGSLRRRPDLKTELRGRFWFGLQHIARVRRAQQTLAQAHGPNGQTPGPSQHAGDTVLNHDRESAQR
jgi:hypothetical protein